MQASMVQRTEYVVLGVCWVVGQHSLFINKLNLLPGNLAPESSALIKMMKFDATLLEMYILLAFFLVFYISV